MVCGSCLGELFNQGYQWHSCTRLLIWVRSKACLRNRRVRRRARGKRRGGGGGLYCLNTTDLVGVDCCSCPSWSVNDILCWDGSGWDGSCLFDVDQICRPPASPAPIFPIAGFFCANSNSYELFVTQKRPTNGDLPPKGSGYPFRIDQKVLGRYPWTVYLGTVLGSTFNHSKHSRGVHNTSSLNLSLAQLVLFESRRLISINQTRLCCALLCCVWEDT